MTNFSFPTCGFVHRNLLKQCDSCAGLYCSSTTLVELEGKETKEDLTANGQHGRMPFSVSASIVILMIISIVQLQVEWNALDGLVAFFPCFEDVMLQPSIEPMKDRPPR